MVTAIKRTHTRKGFNRSAETALEDPIDLLLGAWEREGRLVQEHHLLRARDYPDFWAKDRKGREYLIECKNCEPKTVTNPRNFEDKNRWVEEYKWTESHILTKAWTLPKYESRPELGKKHGVWIEVSKPLPVLITRYANFDLESLGALQALFQNRIIAFGYDSPKFPRINASFVAKRLLQLFERR